MPRTPPSPSTYMSCASSLPPRPNIARVNFRQASQKEDKSILAWLAHLRLLHSRAYPAMPAADQATNTDLNNKVTANHVWNRRPDTYAQTTLELQVPYLGRSFRCCSKGTLHARQHIRPLGEDARLEPLAYPGLSLH